MTSNTSRESGLGLVALFLGSTVLAVAVLGTVGGLMTSLKLAIDTKDANVAGEQALAVVREFRKSAADDFDAAIAAFQNRTVHGNGAQNIRARIILDETRFDPPVDLNGDGDFDDTNLLPNQVNAAYIETTVAWGNNKSRTFVTLVSRTGPTKKKNRGSTARARPGY